MQCQTRCFDADATFSAGWRVDTVAWQDSAMIRPFSWRFFADFVGGYIAPCN